MNANAPGLEKIELRGKPDQRWEQSRSYHSKHAQCKNGLRAVQKHQHFYHSVKGIAFRKYLYHQTDITELVVQKGSHLYP